MRKSQLKLAAMLLLGICLTTMHAQDVIPAAGGEASGSGGSASYSIGQVVFTTPFGSTGTVIQGVQLPFEISVVSGIEAGEITLKCTVYPNPASDLLLLKIDGELQSHCIASLYDISGKQLSNQNIESNETRIDMRNLIAGTYFLKISVQKRNVFSQKDLSRQEIKTFKIIKN